MSTALINFDKIKSTIGNASTPEDSLSSITAAWLDQNMDLTLNYLHRQSKGLFIDDNETDNTNDSNETDNVDDSNEINNTDDFDKISNVDDSNEADNVGDFKEELSINIIYKCISISNTSYVDSINNIEDISGIDEACMYWFNLRDPTSYKLVILDLDGTLYGDTLLPDVMYCIDIFKQLGCKMAIASFNKHAGWFCERLGIKDNFDPIIGYHDKDNFHKFKHIADILLHHKIQEKDCLFFDDRKENIMDIGLGTDITSIQVNPKTGIRKIDVAWLIGGQKPDRIIL